MTPHPTLDLAAAPVTRRRTLLAAALGLPAAAVWPGLAWAEEAGVRSLLQRRLALQGVGLAAARIDGAKVDAAVAGRRHAERAAAGEIAADDLFEIGSITKTFTALLLADMVVRRELALDDPVESVLGSGARLRDSQDQPLRWRDLATHRSGLPRLAPNGMNPANPADPYADYGADKLKAFIAEWRADKPRDTAWAYSNLGYGLLGEALAARLGTDYASALRQRVLAPLGLDGMQLSLTGQPEPAARLSGHDATQLPVPAWHAQSMAGAGMLLGSVQHMARYAQAALGLVDTPLREAFALALKPLAQGPNAANPIGLGWIMGPLNGRQVANHDGGTFGFASSLFLDPERRRASVVLSNAAIAIQDLALHLLDAAVPLREPQPVAAAPAASAPAPTAAQLAELDGSYALNPQFKLRVRAQGSQLFAQASGQGEFELFARGPRQFFAKVTPLSIVFEGEAGAPPALTLFQAGQQLRFVRD